MKEEWRNQMQVSSNAFFDQVEIVQPDRWSHGPLELIFVDFPNHKIASAEMLAFVDWNRRADAGFVRQSETVDAVSRFVPRIEARDNPNIILVPRVQKYTELHEMLTSVLPDRTLQKYRLERSRSNFWLWPFEAVSKAGAAERMARAFEEFIWTRIARGRRRLNGFSKKSSLHLLAGDTTFWMNRLYRVAIERRQGFPEVRPEPGWRPMEMLAEDFRRQVREHDQYVLRRPLTGGWLWDPDSPAAREEVVADMLSGAGVMESLAPVIDVLHSHPTHEDFSGGYSWIKEDFERSFYSKRAKVKITLLQTLDDSPAWTAPEPEGYSNVLLRDVMSFCDVKERRIIIALREGKTISEIASEEGLRGHAAISRRVAKLRSKIRKLLQ